MLKEALRTREEARLHPSEALARAEAANKQRMAKINEQTTQMKRAEQARKAAKKNAADDSDDSDDEQGGCVSVKELTDSMQTVGLAGLMMHERARAEGWSEEETQARNLELMAQAMAPFQEWMEACQAQDAGLPHRLLRPASNFQEEFEEQCLEENFHAPSQQAASGTRRPKMSKKKKEQQRKERQRQAKIGMATEMLNVAMDALENAGVRCACVKQNLLAQPLHSIMRMY